MRIGFLALFVCLIPGALVHAQDLVPGVYTPSPVGFNVVTLVANFHKGDVTFDPSLPVEDGRASITGMAIGYTRTFNLAGRYANAGLVVPFMHGHLEGILLGQFEERTRSGPADAAVRIAVNLYGGPAMTRKDFAGYRATTIVGLSLGVVLPVGQYDPSKIINISTHRWSFKPEIGVSRRRGRWTIEGDLGGVFFTDNTNFFNGGRREQAPIVAFQGHLLYTIRPGFWVAMDGNFWRGGRVTTNGTKAIEQQQNSRLGATLAVPIRRHQLRIAYSSGAYTRLGGDFHSIGVSYSYAWTRR